jgi:transposase
MPAAERHPSPEWREKRRLRAWELHHLGWSQRQIAAALGVTQGAVSHWIKRANEGGGAEALRRRPHPGRQAALTDEQLGQLPALLEHGPETYGIPGNRWTLRRVAELIKEIFGASYHPAHVSRLLRRCCPGWRDKLSEK